MSTRRSSRAHGERSAYVLAAFTGAAVWIAIALASGRREAWDSSAYFALGLPLLCAGCFILGWRFRRAAWRWGVAAMAGQLAVLVASSREFGLLPLGVIAFAVLSVPAAMAGMLGAWAGRRFAPGEEPSERP